jgi:hypothetical protein
MTTTANAPPDGPSESPPLKTCSVAEIGAIAHLYRGEIYRSTVWRTRLDSTTNWAGGYYRHRPVRHLQYPHGLTAAYGPGRAHRDYVPAARGASLSLL